jgi:hypothetical protein
MYLRISAFEFHIRNAPFRRALNCPVQQQLRYISAQDQALRPQQPGRRHRAYPSATANIQNRLTGLQPSRFQRTRQNRLQCGIQPILKLNPFLRRTPIFGLIFVWIVRHFRSPI